VQTVAATAAAASAGNNDVMNRVSAALERLGIKRNDMQTRQITLSRIDYGPERGRFRANNMVEVRVRNLDRAGEAIAATTEAGANVLSGPNMTVSDPEAASRSAYAAACKAARARAEAGDMAGAAAALAEIELASVAAAAEPAVYELGQVVVQLLLDDVDGVHVRVGGPVERLLDRLAHGLDEPLLVLGQRHQHRPVGAAALGAPRPQRLLGGDRLGRQLRE
ncbi:MAG: SIMPL domain-containing protein, partial [Actinobacteria bacterium]|nr:SIMPL domain-containing protein [Actinomycetota bacterium]